MMQPDGKSGHKIISSNGYQVVWKYWQNIYQVPGGFLNISVPLLQKLVKEKGGGWFADAEDGAMEILDAAPIS